MNNICATSRIFHILLILALITACKKKKDVDPVEIIPIGKAYVTVESDGKRETYIEGSPGVESLNIAKFDIQHQYQGHGGAISVKDKDRC